MLLFSNAAIVFFLWVETVDLISWKLRRDLPSFSVVCFPQLAHPCLMCQTNSSHPHMKHQILCPEAYTPSLRVKWIRHSHTGLRIGLGAKGPILKQNLVYPKWTRDWTVDWRLDRMPSRGPWRAERSEFQWSGEKEECSRAMASPWIESSLHKSRLGPKSSK